MSKYEIKELIDKLIFGSFNLLSQLFFHLKSEKRLVNGNKKFKDIHKGERCFILGTGPSLRDVDVTLLKNEIIFGLNYLYKGNIIDKVKIKYYCLYDEIFHGKNISDSMEILSLLPNTEFFVRTKAYNNFRKSNLLSDKVNFQACNLFQHGDLIRVDMTKNMTAPYNVVLGCIQTAIYMGFEEIYLLGCDFNSFATLKVEHFYDDKKNESPSRHMSLGYEIKFYSLVAYHHYALEKYASQNGVKIINVTHNSLLDAYERKDYHELFENIK